MGSRLDDLSAVRRVVVKLGSQVVAPGGEIDEDRLDSICEGLAGLRRDGLEVLIVTSGAIASGRHLLGWRDRPRTIPMKQAAAAAGQPEMMRSYGARFARHGLKVAQILLTAEDIRDRRRFVNARDTIETLLAHGALPIVNENDSVADEEIRLGDNDRLSALVTQLAGADLLILLTDVDGFYDSDPRARADAKRHGYLESVDEVHRRQAGPTRSEVGLGGMATKIEAARQASLSGAATVIASGLEDRVVERILAGEEVGTWIAPNRGLRRRKQWIAFSREPRGSVVVDRGAVEALAKSRRSLLASGVLRVDGEFDRGEVLGIRDETGAEIARGLAGYSAADMRRIRGRRSQEIEGILGYKYYDAVVHRDNLVVLGGEAENGSPVKGETDDD